MRNLNDWKRLGSEAEAEDRRDGFDARGGTLTDNEIRVGLHVYFTVDLCNPEICEDEEAALDALVDGYRHGG
jgi:hypothetical protein